MGVTPLEAATRQVALWLSATTWQSVGACPCRRCHERAVEILADTGGLLRRAFDLPHPTRPTAEDRRPS